MKKIKQAVCVDIKSTQYTDTDSDTIEFFTCGELRSGGGSYSLVYDETDAQNRSNNKVTLNVDSNNIVTMKRKGSSNADLIIEKGKKHYCHYGTELGNFIVGITADEILSRLSDKGGELCLKYTIDVNSNLVCKNEMKINIREIVQ